MSYCLMSLHRHLTLRWYVLVIVAGLVMIGMLALFYSRQDKGQNKSVRLQGRMEPIHHVRPRQGLSEAEHKSEENTRDHSHFIRL